MTVCPSRNRVLSDLAPDARPMTLHLTGPEVARARRSYGMTGFDLARRAGVSVNWLFAVENGRCATERLDKLNKALLDYVLSRRSS